MNARVKTSASEPLRIAEVPAGRGVVGLSFCPGKRAPAADGSYWERSLEADLEQVARFGTRVVVSLIEEHEYAMLGVEGLAEAARARGLAWYGLPIPDGGVPGFEWELRWAWVGRRLRERLRRGERVFVHCRGGLGRAGMVAARLLVEFGVEPASAIAQLRGARPGAIETVPQAAWVRRQQAVRRRADQRAARELAVLLGGAIGDALGYRVAFDREEAIRARYGQTGIRLANARGPLVISDDTQMTLFTLEGLTRAVGLVEPFTNDGALAEMRRAYLDWYGTQQVGEHEPRGPLAREAVLRARRAPEQTCLAALAREEASARCVQERPFAHEDRGIHGPGTIAQPINDSKGCGGVMRVAPIGFLSAEVSDDRLFALAAASAALTHGHPDGYWPAGVMALLVRALLAEESWMQAIARVVAQLQNAAETAGTIRAVSAALSWVGSGAPIGVLGQGRTGDEALSIGLAAALQAQSFEECVALAANHDGASDSTASIAGQLYAAAHGLEVLPEEAVERLDALLPILDVAEGWRAACEE